MAPEYRLSEEALRKRALLAATISSATAVAPAVFVLLALARLLVAPAGWLVGAAGAVVLLAAIRAGYTLSRMKRHLRAFTVRLEDMTLVVRTFRGLYELPPTAITALREVPGVLGGLELDLAPGWDGRRDSPEVVDIPRGGEGFGDLRAGLERMRPLEPPRHLSRVVRALLVVFVVVALFFLPFVLDAARGTSRLFAIAIVLAFWVVMRMVLRRR